MSGKYSYSIALIALGLLLLSLPDASAAIDCVLRNACNAGELDAFHLSAVNNAHAELSAQTQYSSRVCCSATGGQTLSNSCSGTDWNQLMALSSSTDAHAQETGFAPSYSSNNFKVCLNVDVGTIDCGYYGSALTPMAAGYQACLARLSATTNAHLESCASAIAPLYPIAIGCRVGGINQPPIANAGGDQYWDVSQNFTMLGSALDRDGTINSLTWSIVPATGCTFSPNPPGGINSANATRSVSVNCATARASLRLSS